MSVKVIKSMKGINKSYSGNKPQTGNLFVDFLSITLGISPDEREGVLKAMEELCSAYGLEMRPSSRYRHKIKMPSGDGHLIIEAMPRTPSHNFFRIEFNPSKVDLFEVMARLNMLIKGGYAQLLNEGKITRIDLTFDVSYVEIYNLYSYYPNFQYSKVFLRSGDMETAVMETTVLGEDNSPKTLTVYDKIAEMIEHNKDFLKTELAIPPYPITRVEMTLRKKALKGCHAKDLLGLQNPFTPLKIVTRPDSKDEPLMAALLLSARFVGFNSALNAIFSDKNLKQIYRDRVISEGDGSWWDAGELWSGLENALKAIGCKFA